MLYIILQIALALFWILSFLVVLFVEITDWDNELSILILAYIFFVVLCAGVISAFSMYCLFHA